MTSSLVGSEMCIRDRLKAARVVTLWVKATREVGKLGGAPVLEAASYEAVSYTHLTLPTICSV
eukprot:12508900-Prorocentrum_lima.AAC.1